MMAEVSDAKRFTVVLKGLSNQVRPFSLFNLSGTVVGSCGERAFVETDIPSVYLLCW